MNAAINRKANLLSNRSASTPPQRPRLKRGVALLLLSLRGNETYKKKRGKNVGTGKVSCCFPRERNFLESHMNPERRDFSRRKREEEGKERGKKGNLSSNRFRSTPSRYRNHFRPTTGWLDFVPLILRAASYPGITMETGDAVSMENRRQRYTKPTRDHEISACRLPAGHEISFNGSIGRGRGGDAREARKLKE